jgi:hypothetical protein
MRRQHWNHRLAQALSDRGIDVDRHFGSSWDRQRIQHHRSPVIDSIIVNYGHPMEQPHDYFGALCSVSAKSMAPASVTFARF